MESSNRNAVRLYKEKLNMLLDVAQMMNEDHQVDDLLQAFEQLLTKELGVGRILVYLHNDNLRQIVLATCSRDEVYRSISVERDLLGITTIDSLAMNENGVLHEFDYVIPLFHKHKIVSYVLIGDSEVTAGVSSSIKNLKFIQILANVIIVFVENKKMQQELQRQSYLQRELELAKNIQSALVPNDEQLLQTSIAKVRTIYQPHHEVGGDYYDVIDLGDDSVGFCIADVSGKGIAAALLMSNFQALVRALFTPEISMAELVKRLNAKVYDNSANGKFITAFIGRYTASTGKLSYVNAAHLPPLLYTPQTKQMRELEQGCIGLGMLDEIPGIDVGEVTIESTSRLIAFTDGLIEIDEGNRVQQQMESLKYILNNTKSLEGAMMRIAAMAYEHREAGMTFDDVSVLGIQMSGLT